MKLLLDTCVFMWVLSEPDRVSKDAQKSFLDTANERCVSYLSMWEITIKNQLGKMPLPKLPGVWLEEECRRRDIALMPVSLPDIYKLGTLPYLHRDPFDRMLIAQALQNGMTILTNDSEFAQYNVPIIW